MVVAGDCGEGGQKVQTFSYNTGSEDLMYSMVTIVNNVVYLKFAKRIKHFHQKVTL